MKRISSTRLMGQTTVPTEDTVKDQVYRVYGVAWDREQFRRVVLSNVHLTCRHCGLKVPCTTEDHRVTWLCDRCVEIDLYA